MIRFFGMILGILLVCGVFWFYANSGTIPEKLKVPEKVETVYRKAIEKIPTESLKEKLGRFAEGLSTGTTPYEIADRDVTPIHKEKSEPVFIEKPVAPNKTRSQYVFWGPFRVRSSAKGFASRLKELTGLDIQVMKRQRGQYLVAFSFGDEQERLGNIRMIEERTGMALKDRNLNTTKNSMNEG